MLDTPHVSSQHLARYVVPNHLNGSSKHAVKLDPQRLAAFDPKVQSAIVRLHLRREYISLDPIIDEIKDRTVIEQLFYLEFLHQQRAGYIDRAVGCNRSTWWTRGSGNFVSIFAVAYPIRSCRFSPPILFYVEIDSFQWHDRTPKEFAKGKRRMRVLQRKGQAAYVFAGSEVWHNAMACVFEVIGAMEINLMERRRMARLVTFAASRHGGG